MNRWKASATHLGTSAIIAGVVVGIMLKLWYPPPYFDAMRGGTLLLLIVGCDIVLGPLITLIIFKAGKKGLKLDLAIIGCVQLAALAYGTYTIFIVRPAFTVFAIDRFEVVAASDIRPEDLAKGSSPEFSTLSLTGPRLVAAHLPDSASERDSVTLQSAGGGEDIKQLPRLYVPYLQMAPDAARRAKPVSLLLSRSKSAGDMLARLQSETGMGAGDLGFLPLSARNQSMTVIVNKKSGQIEGILPINPW